MNENKRTKLEKQHEILVTRQQMKAAQLAEARTALKLLNENLAGEVDNTKWEALVTQHNQLNIRITALIDELAVLAEKARISDLAIIDYDLSVVHADISQLINESSEIRAKTDTLHEEFRRLINIRSSNLDTKQRILDIKTELGQFSLAGELNRRELEAIKRKRDVLTSQRQALETTDNSRL